MAERHATILRVALILITVESVFAKRFSIMAPNVFHIGVKEQVSISVFDAQNPVTVKLYLQDYPHRRKTFSRVEGRVQQGNNLFLAVKVEPEDLPDTASVDKQYVYLVAKCDDAHFQFHKEAKILLSYKNGMVFIQTDKPIYTPKQSVKIRIIPLEFDMKPSRRKITVGVLNPQGIRVQQWKELDTSTGIISKVLNLEEFTLMGNWTIAAFYGHQDIHNTSVQFEVKEYVLPKFSVKLTIPPFILNTDNWIAINITTRYTYGKAVVGSAVVHLSIAGNATIVPFAKHNVLLHRSGITSLRGRVQVIRELPGNLWFPESSRLLVQVDVIERATGNKESAMDKSCQFTSSPYVIKFKNTPGYFKPGLRYVVKVVVTHPNKQPAGNVPMLITANGIYKGKVMEELRKFDQDPNVRGVTDEFGEAEFVIDACANCGAIKIQVETVNNKLANVSQNAVGNYLAFPFNAGNGPLIMVRQLSPGKVGRKINCESYRTQNNVAVKLSFAVVSRGRILFHNTTDLDGMFKSWSFLISSQMSPSARLIGYYIDNNEQVVADSILLDVEDSLPTKVDFPDAYVEVDGSRVQLNQVEKIPGEKYSWKIKAPSGTRLGLLSVDQSVYLLKNENRLTKERIFKTVEELDLGCGVGRGKDSWDIFKNAGVVLMTNNFVSDGRQGYDCNDDKSRKERSVKDDHDFEYKICCDMGKDNGNVTCVKLSIDSNRQLSKRCRMAFWKCCKDLHGIQDGALLGRNAMDLGDFDRSDEEILDQTQVRSYFPETWIYDEKVAGPSGLLQMNVEIPHTITTWVMQAVAINNKTGLGLATPLRIVGYQDFFISLKMPYSVKRGEQVSLLATVFNYDREELRAKLYLKGDKDFCSIASHGALQVIGVVRVPPNDARSVAVPIVPKRIGEIELEVSSILQVKFGLSYRNVAGDAVKRKLLVVPEGKKHLKSQSFILDPTGYLNDGPKRGENKADKPTQSSFKSERHVRPKEQFQFDSIELVFPKEAIPGSVGAVVYLTGNVLGPVINATIEGDLAGRFLIQPYGCGEQTMRSFAPNVYVLEYLMSTNQLTGANERDAYSFIQSGYGRVQRFRRSDGSFSIWGNNRPGDIWLTAYIMRILCKAQKVARVAIDKRRLKDSVTWLMQNQRWDGALPGFSELVYRRYLVGQVSNEGDVGMTAFVLSALGECRFEGLDSQVAILRAKDYLERKYKDLYRPYSMALTAYALSLVNSKEKLNANNRLVQNAIYDNAKKSRYWNAGGGALNVETAGYALMTQVILGRSVYAGPIVTYLTNQRRGGVGFASSQDTFVALQALSLYSESTASNPLDLRVKLTSEKDADWEESKIHITEDNALLRRQIDVKNLMGGKLYVETRGTGVGVLEVEVRYNLPTSRNETCKFELKTDVKEVKDNSEELLGPVQNDAVGEGVDNRRVEKQKKDKNKKGGKRKRGCRGKNKNKKRCQDKGKKPKNKKQKPPAKHQPVKSINLKVCTRYREKVNTSMAIMEIGILTGFKPKENLLKKLQDNVPELDNFEVSDNVLVFYFSEIPNYRELCVDVQFYREHYVGVVQAVPVNVYDYYEPDESCSVFYGPDKYSPLSLGVCDVGSRSCKCSQDECAQQDPPIGNIVKLINKACADYHYVIKGKVLLIDEQNTMLAYVVEVLQIIQQGNKDLKVGQTIELWKRGTCQSPDLKENKEYLFMGKFKGDRYDLDKTSFVKLWPKSPANDKDKIILEDFAAQYAC